MRWNPFVEAVLKCLSSDLVRSSVLAAGIGVCLSFGLSLAIGTVGFSFWSTSGLLCAVAVCLDVAWRYVGRVSGKLKAGSGIALLAWPLVAPMLASRTFDIATTLMKTAMLDPMGAVVSGLLVGLMTVGLPCLLGSAILAGSDSTRWSVPLGLFVGLAGASLIPIALGGAQVVAVSAVISCACVLAFRYWIREDDSPGD